MGWPARRQGPVKGRAFAALPSSWPGVASSLAGKSDGARTRYLPQQPMLKLETVYFRRAKPMKTRITYIECKGNEISGPAHWSCDVFQVWQVLVLPRTPIPYAFRRWVQSKLF